MNRRKIDSIRNILNITFMLLALAAMVGVIAFPNGSTGNLASYGVGLLAVVIKMVEVCLRMPTMRKP